MDGIRIPGSLSSLEPIRIYVRQVSEQAGLDKKRAYRLQLAIDEIATNIVRYGYQDGTIDGEIVLESTIGPEELTITLKDTATRFDPFSRTTPGDLDKPLQDRPIGGLGIFLAIENVDEYRYAYEDGMNKNIFIVQRNADGKV
jgi:anti-sigma regulatory factor (Ser/Thr protein kinase)